MIRMTASFNTINLITTDYKLKCIKMYYNDAVHIYKALEI